MREEFLSYVAGKVDHASKNEYIYIPHLMPPRVVVSEMHPDADEDARDMHAVISIGDAFTYKGHQQAKVVAMAVAHVRRWCGQQWLEQLACEFLHGESLNSENAQSVLSWPLLDWDCLWPEVDMSLVLTGYTSDGGLTYNYRDEAMIQLDEDRILSMLSDAEESGDEKLAEACRKSLKLDSEALQVVGEAMFRSSAYRESLTPGRGNQ